MVDNTSLILSIDSTQSLGIICTPHRHGSETRSRGNRIEPTPTLTDKNWVDRVRALSPHSTYLSLSLTNSLIRDLELPLLYFDLLSDLDSVIDEDTKLAIKQWITSPNPMIQQMAKNMMIKFDKFWGVIHNVMGVVTLLDPRYNMELLEYYYEKLYEHDYFTQVRCIQQLCYDLVSDYQMKMNKDSFGSNVGDVTGSEVVGDALFEYDRFIIRKKKGSMSYKVVAECATVMNEMVSDDECEMMGAAGVTNLEELLTFIC
ncbi:Zinc finger BED domain-containing protein RICESLEEPER 3 [Glycine soja]